MRLFQRPKPVEYSTKIVTPEATKRPEDMQKCAACGMIGATICLPPASYFGYIRLPFILLCDACHEAYVEAKCNHHFKQRKVMPDTVTRIAAIQVAKQKSTGVQE